MRRSVYAPRRDSYEYVRIYAVAYMYLPWPEGDLEKQTRKNKKQAGVVQTTLDTWTATELPDGSRKKKSWA